jgi:hypothetical protein
MRQDDEMKSTKRAAWSDVKVNLNGFDRAGLLGVIRSLYEANAANRRFLHARFVPTASALEEYRNLVQAAVFPPPLGQRPVRLREASAAIAEYQRSTGDLGGVVDLLLTFVEAGTEQAADLGYGDDAYFATLERKVKEVVAALDALPDSVRGEATTRLVRLAEYQDLLGWGYGDFLGDVAARVQAGHSGRLVRSVVTRSNHRIEPARLLSRTIKATRRAGHS